LAFSVKYDGKSDLPSYLTENDWTAIYPCPVVNFHISGTKWASSGTRDTMGQFRDDPGHSGMVGKPSHCSNSSLLPPSTCQHSDFFTR